MNNRVKFFFKRIQQSSYSVTILALSISLLISGCATGPSQEIVQEEDKSPVWPSPPTQAVIKHLYSFNSSAAIDVKKTKTWKDSLLGEEDERIWVMKSPYGVSIDTQGRILIADIGFHGLPVFDFEKREFLIFGLEPPGLLGQPVNASADRFGRIYVTEGRAQKVSVYDLNGAFLNTLGSNDDFERPVGVAVDNQRERVYVSDSLKHHVAVFDLEGVRISTIGERGVDPGYFNFPLNLALDSEGRLYIVDSMNFRIQVVDPDTGGITIIGQQGTNPGQFARPKGIAIDSDDNIYVTDAAFGNVQMFNREGALLMFFGSAGVGPGEFALPAGIAIDPQDRIYVADQSNRRIQVFQYLGKPEIEDPGDDIPER